MIYTHSLYIYIPVSWPQSFFGVRLTPGPSLGEAVSFWESLAGAGIGQEWVFSLRKKGRLEIQQWIPDDGLWEDPHPCACSLLHPKDENTAASPPWLDVQAGTGYFGPQVDRSTLSGTWLAEAAGRPGVGR